MKLDTDRLILRTIPVGKATLLMDYLNRNIEFLREWSPERPDEPYTLAEAERLVRKENRVNRDGSGIRLFVSVRGEERIIGTVGLSSITRGAFQSCFLGYKLDRDETGKGYMTEAVKCVVDHAFESLRLHRIEANIMPRNSASIRVVRKLGFVEEGRSPRYLKIRGKWEDHIHFVLLNEAI